MQPAAAPSPVPPLRGLQLRVNGAAKARVVLSPSGTDPWTPERALESGLVFETENQLVAEPDFFTGTFDVWVEAPGFASLLIPRGVTIGEDSLGVVSVEMLPGGVAAGTVTAASSGAALPGATVTARLSSASLLRGPLALVNAERTVVTRDDGAFSIDTLLSDALYEVTAHADGYAPATRQILALRHAELFTLALEPEAVLVGTVAAGDGAPAAGATVLALRDGRAVGEVVADASGAYRIGALRAGRYHLLARAGDAVSALESAIAPATAAALTLHAGGVWTLTVVGADDDAPIGGARVEVSPVFPFDVRAQPAVVAYTDEHGAARVAGLFAGVYQAYVEADGYVPVGSGPDAPSYAERLLGPAAGTRAVVKPGETAETRVRLPSARPLTGRVVAGTRGVPEAEVIALAFDARGGYVDTGRRAVLDGNGVFYLDGLLPGRYALLARAPGLAPAYLPHAVAGGAHIQLALTTGGGVSGRVVRADGAGQPYAYVRAVRVDPLGQLPAPLPHDDALCDAGGGFAFSHLRAGVYTFAVDHDRLAVVWPPLVTVREGQATTDIELILGGGAEVRGTARRMLDGKPAAGVCLRLRHERRAPREATSEADGAFRFIGIAPDLYQLEVVAAPPDLALPPPVMVEVGMAGMRALTVDLPPAGAVRGTARTALGRPAAGARVTALSLDDERAGRAAVRVETLVDAQGRFAVQNLPLDRALCLTVVAPELAPTVSAPFVLTAASDEAVFTLTLNAGGALSGRVRAADGSPVAARLVRCAPAHVPLAWGACTLSNDDGAFHFDTVTPGLVGVGADDGAAVRVMVAAGRETGEVELTLPTIADATGALRGRVVDGSGQPVAGAALELERVALPLSGPSPVYACVSGADGQFARYGLPPGVYSLRVRAADRPWWFRQGSVSVPGGEIEVVLAGGGALKGEVLDDASGTPVPCFRLSVRGLSDGARWVEHASGAFRLDGLPAGRRSLLIEADGYAPALLGPFVIGATTETTVTARLDRGATLRGRVIDAHTGKPVPRAAVELIDSIKSGDERDGLSAEWGMGARGAPVAYSAADGAFVLVHVPAGQPRLRVTHPEYAVALSDVLAATGDAVRADIEVALNVGAAIVGTVIGGDDAPRAFAEVVCRPSGVGALEARRVGAAGLRTVTDADGAFRFDPLPEGAYVVEAVLEDGALTRRTVRVDAGVELRLRLGAGPLSVRGTVRRAGKAVSGMLVALSDRPATLSSRWSASARTDRHGRYTLSGVAPPERGEVYLQVYETEATLWASPLVSLPLALDGDEIERDIELPAASVSGRVVDGKDRPLPRAMISLLEDGKPPPARGERPRHGLSDASGRFQISAVPAGEHVLLAECEGYRAATQAVTVVEGASSKSVTITLHAESASLRGSVADVDGAPLARGTVLVAPAGEPLTQSQGVRRAGVEDGAFVVTKLTAGRYDLLARGGDGRAAFALLRELEVEAGEPTTCALRLRPARQVHFRAVGADGKPRPDVVLRLLDRAGRPHPLAKAAGAKLTVTVHDEVYRVQAELDGVTVIDVDYDMSGFADGQTEDLVLEPQRRVFRRVAPGGK